MPRRVNKKALVLTAVYIMLALAFFCIYLSRGWLRGPAVSWLATQMYAKSVDRAFDPDLAPLNDRLHKFGLKFRGDGRGKTDGKAACYDLNFSFVRESLNCGKWLSVYEQAVPLELLRAWPTESGHIKHLLSSGGWAVDHEAPYAQEPKDADLSNLFSGDQSIASMSYSKQTGKLTCSIGFSYYHPDPPATSTLSIYEYCGRNIKIFGGYSL